MTTLSEKWLKDNKACRDGIDFAIRNKLIGYPLDKLNEICGDYNGYIGWMIKQVAKIDNPTHLPTEETIDSDGNKVVCTIGNGNFKSFITYGEHGLLHMCDDNGYELWCEYNKHGKQIKWWNNRGDVKTWDYDDHGNVVHGISYSEHSPANEFWYEYDDHGNNTHNKHDNGIETWLTYNDDNQITKCIDSNGQGYQHKYDDRGNSVLFQDYSGHTVWNEYDDNGNHTMMKDSTGYQLFYFYDVVGNVILTREDQSIKLDNPTVFYDNGQLKSIGSCVFAFIG